MYVHECIKFVSFVAVDVSAGSDRLLLTFSAVPLQLCSLFDFLSDSLKNCKRNKYEVDG